jgi:hypothetical protein
MYGKKDWKVYQSNRVHLSGEVMVWEDAGRKNHFNFLLCCLEFLNAYYLYSSV